MAGSRHLTRSQAEAAVRRGAQIEQLLGVSEGNAGKSMVAWLTAAGSPRGVVLCLHVVEDVGTDDYFDVTEFPPIDEDAYAGEGNELVTGDVDLVFQAARDRGAQDDRWVNQGLICDEYREARSSA